MNEARPLARITASVDLAAIRHNLNRVRALAPGSRVMAAVKADAYGHGAVAVARALAAGGVDALAVACLAEGLALRAAGVDLPVALLEGALSPQEALAALAADLQLVTHSAWQIELLRALPPAVAPRIWFKLDTGMHRLGFPAEEAAALWQLAQRHPHWQVCGWMTHLACADQLRNPMTLRQIAAFEAALSGLPGPRSVGNSAGLLAWPAARTEWVRPGLMLYGASPFETRDGTELGLRPAMRLHSRLIACHRLEAGEAVGYGAIWRSPRSTRIGVVATGYADGIHRCLPNGTPVLVRGQRVPLVGRISMDMLTIDLHDVSQAGIGDEVVFWGDGLAVEEIAAAAGTLPYELFCSLNHRIEYLYGDA